jgi:very-short-patch-repair endonuclease
MKLPRSRKKVPTARRLRRDSTDAERTLWLQLRDRRLEGWKFRRQVSIDPYIIDFLCLDAKLVIEVDGGQHDENRAKDEVRTRFLEGFGLRVIRFWNHEVLGNLEGVRERILIELKQRWEKPDSA